MEKEKNKKLGIILISTVLLLALLVGITYAFYKITLEGERVHTIDTNDMTFSYKEQDNEVDLEIKDGMNDVAGSTQGNYFEFEVSASSRNAITLPYYIFITNILTAHNFPNNQVRIHLTRVNGNTETQIVAPTLVSNLQQVYNANSKLLYSSQFVFDGNSDDIVTYKYRLRVWLQESFRTTDLVTEATNANGEQTFSLEDYTYSFKVNVTSTVGLDRSGANYPELVTGMIPVYYDEAEDVWKKADINNIDVANKWFDYDNKMWANAVTVTSANRGSYTGVANGTPIPMSDINAMFVWIPRFRAVTPSNFNGGTALAPGAIDVTFADTTEPAHDAFWWDEDSDGVSDSGEQKNGFWFGKFETSAATIPTAASTTLQVPIIKPGLPVWRYGNIATFYNSIKNYANGASGLTNYGFSTSDTYDAHMMKNNEWAAMAYLTQSIYGRCTSSFSCTEVTGNNCNTFKTGIGGDSISSAASATTCTTSKNQYNGANGMLASTTGNVYGIYDTSNGAAEYVMGNYNNDSGSSGLTMTSILSKYKNVYTTAAAYTSAGLQHSIIETQGWYSDYHAFVTSSSEFFLKSGWHGSSPINITGVFYQTTLVGDANINRTTRVIIVK